jgi:hypothetical protein
VAKEPDPLDGFQKAMAALASLITAITSGVLAGHTIGWW